MQVAVVGGKLQGVEATYLAHKAGWSVVLIDKNNMVPAQALCDSFCHLDVTNESKLIQALKNIDLIIPALENKEALDSLVKCTNFLGLPLVFDISAYAISSSKIKSNQLFARLGVPAPIPWPGCSFPIIAKPSGASGSDGVIKLDNPQEFEKFKNWAKTTEEWVIEEFLEGPSFSIEVIGFAGNYKVLQVTELEMDKVYDCKRVLTSALLDQKLVQQFEDIGLKIARSINLNGIMDVETILNQGNLKVLEIDARLPSQTPTAVFHSTGINMVQILGDLFTKGKASIDFNHAKNLGVVYEHIKVDANQVEVAGEHIMANTYGLKLMPNFFGADEAITDYAPGKEQWVATLIITGMDRQHAWEKRCKVIQRIGNEIGVTSFIDTFPERITKTVDSLRSL